MTKNEYLELLELYYNNYTIAFEYNNKVYIELDNDVDYASLEFDCIELKAGALKEALKRMLKGKKALSIRKILESYEMRK